MKSLETVLAVGTILPTLLVATAQFAAAAPSDGGSTPSSRTDLLRVAQAANPEELRRENAKKGVPGQPAAPHVPPHPAAAAPHPAAPAMTRPTPPAAPGAARPMAPAAPHPMAPAAPHPMAPAAPHPVAPAVTRPSAPPVAHPVAPPQVAPHPAAPAVKAPPGAPAVGKPPRAEKPMAPPAAPTTVPGAPAPQGAAPAAVHRPPETKAPTAVPPAPAVTAPTAPAPAATAPGAVRPPVVTEPGRPVVAPTPPAPAVAAPPTAAGTPPTATGAPPVPVGGVMPPGAAPTRVPPQIQGQPQIPGQPRPPVQGQPPRPPQGGVTPPPPQGGVTPPPPQGGVTPPPPQGGYAPPPPPRSEGGPGTGALLGAAAAGAAVGIVGGMMMGGQAHALDDVQRQRRETVEGGVTYYSEPGRVIVRDDRGLYLRHDETDRFRDFGGSIRDERDGDQMVRVWDRPDGVRIVTVTDPEGRLIRRVRRWPDGREDVLIDNGFRPRPRTFREEVVVLPPPPVPIERRYVDAERSDDTVIYDTLEAEPFAPLPRRYTLDEVRMSRDVRAYMGAVDVDTITFATGSWTVDPSQVGRLDRIARSITRILAKNPEEIFMVEGHTDAVGSDVDNLSLSDHRAQSVAAILTRDFHVPAENLVTQGYGASELKEKTSGPSQINRRVSVRRITPLLGTAAK